MSEQDEGAGQLIEIPHSHDVLCGRGGLTNQHAGNEWFRRLVKSNRPLYRSCPKHTKILVAKAIVQAVQQQDPPGRFLEVADKEAKTWKQIPYKRCVDKTSQALRERELPEKGDGDLPSSVTSETYHSVTSEAVKLAAQAAAQKQKHKDANLADLAKATLRQAGLERGSGRHEEGFGDDPYHMDRKRSTMERAGMTHPPWWRQGMAAMSADGNHQRGDMGHDGYGNGFSPSNKRVKQDPEEYPSPIEGVDRQTSLFRFLSGTSLFGRSDNNDREYVNQRDVAQGQRSAGFFSFAGGSRGTMGQQALPNPSDLITMEATAFEGINMNSFVPSFATTARPHFAPENHDHATARGGGSHVHDGSIMYEQQYYENKVPAAHMRADYGLGEGVPPTGFMSSAHTNPHNVKMAPLNDVDDVAPPPTNRLTTSVSDWLTSFWPLGKEPDDRAKEPPPPPPPNTGLERSISSTIMTLARSPSQFLTSLKSGVTSMVFGGDPFAPIPITQPTPQPEPPPPMMNHTGGSVRRDSLLDDYEETPMETRLRTITSL